MPEAPVRTEERVAPSAAGHAPAHRHPPQAAARAVVPAAARHAAAHLARRLAAGARLRRPVRGDPHGADGQGRRPRRRAGRGPPRYDETQENIAFAYLVTALLFARSSLYAERAQRPGLPRIVSSLFQVTVVSLIFALVNGEKYSSYYIFYGTLVFADRLRLEHPLGVREGHGRAAARRGLPAPGGARRLGQAHRGGPPRARRRGARARRHARLHLAHPAPGQRAALARRDRGAARGARAPPGAGGHHRRPGLPGGARGRARGPVPPARRHRARRAVDDGDPRAPGGVRPGRLRAALRAAPAGVRRLRLRAQADVRLRRRDRCCCSCSARC